MSDKVFCRKFKEELPKMIRPPYPGPKGEELFNSVSKKAWDEWTALQTTLINEKQFFKYSFINHFLESISRALRAIRPRT